MTEAVVVGVRVRPFNKREEDLKAELCVAMQGTTTTITDEQGKQSSFSFDQSFWSHDGFKDDGTGYMVPDGPDSHYADQKYVFDTFGSRVLNNAWKGYHCTLFAYGQTGAGKSYSMVGYGRNKGIVPVSCEEIFRRVDANSNPSVRFEITVSMVEIYNEAVQDLMVLHKDRPKGGLCVRESKALGVYIDGVTKQAVDSYPALEKAVEIGTDNRTVGQTQMNATSSRSHTVICIEFKQVEKVASKEVTKLSMINLVDLAGSEKAGQTRAEGDRLKEGAMINKSLSALGNVIEKLAEKSSKKHKDVIIPYRDSKLTRLLQNALGGSSKTIMICALSPASSNCEETLSTLRYADRAKKIKNTAAVNENPQDKLLREMREENAKLKAMVENATGGFADMEALRSKQEEVARLERALEESTRSFTERVAESQNRLSKARNRGSNLYNRSGLPFMVNLNPDVQLSGRKKFEFIEGKRYFIGGVNVNDDSLSSDSGEDTDSSNDGDRAGTAERSASSASTADMITLTGYGILPKHAIILNTGGTCTLFCSGPGAAITWVNGKSVQSLMDEKPSLLQVQATSPKPGAARLSTSKRGEAEKEDLPNSGITIMHKDRIAFGRCIFVFGRPEESPVELLIMSGRVSYNKARAELPSAWKESTRSCGSMHYGLADHSDSPAESSDEAEMTALASRLDTMKSEASGLQLQLLERDGVEEKLRQENVALRAQNSDLRRKLRRARRCAGIRADSDEEYEEQSEDELEEAQEMDATQEGGLTKATRPGHGQHVEAEDTQLQIDAPHRLLSPAGDCWDSAHSTARQVRQTREEVETDLRAEFAATLEAKESEIEHLRQQLHELNAELRKRRSESSPESLERLRPGPEIEEAIGAGNGVPRDAPCWSFEAFPRMVPFAPTLKASAFTSAIRDNFDEAIVALDTAHFYLEKNTATSAHPRRRSLQAT